LSVLRELLERAGTLYDAAGTLPRARELHGRGIALVVELAGDACVVRHYHRGGAMADALGDRYFRYATNRVLHETGVSEAVRARGISTPRVKCGAWYTDGLFRRFDIATEFIPDAQDLSEVLFGDVVPGDPVLRRTAELIRGMLEAGLIHEDLNVKNILLTNDGAYVLDLDRCRLAGRVSEHDAQRMRNRFFRSVNKWETRTGQRVHDVARNVLSAAFHA
jgi:tRNA A-37 threonylcarbamoyl transferase component Bud32